MAKKKNLIKFTKMQASGNDFIVLENLDKKMNTSLLKDLAVKLCKRKFGIGADGMLVWEKFKGFDGSMRVFNPDGSEPEMCGNGARCFALYLNKKLRKNRLIIKTKGAVVFCNVKDNLVSIKMPDVKEIKSNIKLSSNSKKFLGNFLNTGVPHVVIFSKNVKKLNIQKYAPPIRFNTRLFPQGTNVNFVEKISANHILVRTYERGVEEETYSCGTGMVASSIVLVLKSKKEGSHTVIAENVYGQQVKVNIRNKGNNFFDIWLEAEAHFVYEGVLLE